MFRYSYDDIPGDTTTPELEFLPPEVSRCVRILKFIGDHRKQFVAGIILCSVLIAAIITISVLHVHGRGGDVADATTTVQQSSSAITGLSSVDDVDGQIRITGRTEQSRHGTATIPVFKAENEDEDSRSNTGKNDTALIEDSDTSVAQEPEPPPSTTQALPVPCILRRRPLPVNPTDKNAISLLYEIETEPPEFTFERCTNLGLFRAFVKVHCLDRLFGPAYARKKLGGSGSAKELVARIAVAQLYNVTYPDNVKPTKIEGTCIAKQA